MFLLQKIRDCHRQNNAGTLFIWFAERGVQSPFLPIRITHTVYSLRKLFSDTFSDESPKCSCFRKSVTVTRQNNGHTFYMICQNRCSVAIPPNQINAHCFPTWKTFTDTFSDESPKCSCFRKSVTATRQNNAAHFLYDLPKEVFSHHSSQFFSNANFD